MSVKYYKNGSLTNVSDMSIKTTGDSGTEQYSFTETIAGQWVDGSTIYKKTVHSGLVNVSGVYEFTVETGYHIGVFVKSEIMMTYSDSVYDLRFAGNVGNGKALVQAYFDANAGKIVFEFNNTYPYSDSYITVYYTKVADS